MARGHSKGIDLRCIVWTNKICSQINKGFLSPFTAFLTYFVSPFKAILTYFASPFKAILTYFAPPFKAILTKGSNPKLIQGEL